VYGTNKDFALGGYMQYELWLSDFNEHVCGPVSGSVVLGGSEIQIINIDSTLYTGVDEVNIIFSDTSSVDGDGCLDSINRVSNAQLSGNYAVGDLIIFGLPETQGDSVVNNPTLDWFLGFLIFFICMVFPIWLFRRK